MKRTFPLAACAAAMLFSIPYAFAQSGSVEKAVGGYSFEDASKEAAGTKDFHSADGHLTFAIVTHTAGNGFFDPVYVGATAAGNLIGAKAAGRSSSRVASRLARHSRERMSCVRSPS